MYRIFTPLALAALTSTASAAPVLWSSAAGGNDHYYEIVETPLSWQDALAAAETQTHAGADGHLATVTSAAEHNFILGLFPAGTPAVWLGGSDGATEGTWEWVAGPEAGTVFWQNGTAIGYNAFIGAEPNNGGGGGDEDGLETGFFGAFWNDRPIGQPWGYVVEYSAVAPVPLPATGLLLAAALGAVALRRKRAATPAC